MYRLRLGDYVKIRTGKLDANKSCENGKYPFFTCAIEPLKIDNYAYDLECILVAGNGDLNVKYYNGKFNAYQRTYIIESLNQEVLLVKYLFHFMEFYISTLRHESIGGVIKYIKLNNLTDAKIPIPSIMEQNQIIQRLELVATLINIKKRKIVLLDSLIRSRFIEMFGDIHSNPKGFSYKKIVEFAKCIAGATPSTKNKDYWNNGIIPWMSSGEVNQGRIWKTEKKISQLGYDSCSTRMIPEHTVVMAMAGQGRTRGTVAIAEIPLCTNQSICSIITDDTIDADYLYTYLQFQYDNLRNISNGSAGRGGLNIKLIGQFAVLVPPLMLQKRFSLFLTECDKSKYQEVSVTGWRGILICCNI